MLKHPQYVKMFPCGHWDLCQFMTPGKFMCGCIFPWVLYAIILPVCCLYFAHPILFVQLFSFKKQIHFLIYIVGFFIVVFFIYLFQTFVVLVYSFFLSFFTVCENLILILSERKQRACHLFTSQWSTSLYSAIWKKNRNVKRPVS